MSAQANKPELLSIPEAAERLGIATKTAYKHAADEVIHTVWVGGSRKVPLSEIERIVREGTRPRPLQIVEAAL